MGVLASHIHVLKKVSLFEESNPFCCLFLNLLKKKNCVKALNFLTKQIAETMVKVVIFKEES